MIGLIIETQFFGGLSELPHTIDPQAITQAGKPVCHVAPFVFDKVQHFVMRARVPTTAERQAHR